ncbi:MAG: exodeoxyribonuclease VII large subunit [Barrevirus sp.]|uniref:Exodeoxyribonuclease VII large subunit n=1 Tax=Barrevirus sp. TaxID=2487763 RepID=A0A3G4ZTW0_9VIRU|nr:MAG: exodeoxyribonuclease VII large subunit [Barrevirus sp.]
MSKDKTEVIQEVTVSELTGLIKDLIQNTFNGIQLSVIGEISNFKLSKNNAFFTLKDEGASINIVFWNYQSKYNSKKSDDIKDGKKVRVSGQITLFAKSGSYNLTCHSIDIIGTGDLYTQYNELKTKYELLGYFDDTKKKKLPSNIGSVGIITAQDGAALQDFLYVIKKNGFKGKIYIKNCLVQGSNCPTSVSEAIYELDQMKLDVIIVCRGGGSFEDLFGFSSEEVVEAIHSAKTCTISAIGHEVDFMISDFVADLRAPTPSIAASLISVKTDTTLDSEEIENLVESIKTDISRKIDVCHNTLLNYKLLLKSPVNIIDKVLQDIELVKGRIAITIKDKLSEINSSMGSAKTLMSSNPQISQGFAFVYHLDEPVHSINDFKKGKKLKIKFYDGEVTIVPNNSQTIIKKYEQ